MFIYIIISGNDNSRLSEKVVQKNPNKLSGVHSSSIFYRASFSLLLLLLVSLLLYIFIYISKW